MIFDWYDSTIQALQELWEGTIAFAPKLIGALLVFLIGWFISVAIGKVVAEILRKLNLNKFFEKGAVKEALDKAEFKVDISGFIGAIFKWVLVIVFLSVAVDILGLVQFGVFLNSILAFLPNIVVAVLILVVAVIIADILEKIARAAVEGVRVGYGNLVGIIVRWSIWVLAIFAILDQLRIAPALIQTLIQGVVGLIVIAGGLAFGLGGKEVAAEILRDLKRKLQR